MEAIVPYAIWAAVIVMVLAILGLVLFGIRSILYGKINVVTGVIVMIPVALLVILGLIIGDWAIAGIWTMVIMFVLAALSLLFSGIRGLFT